MLHCRSSLWSLWLAFVAAVQVIGGEPRDEPAIVDHDVAIYIDDDDAQQPTTAEFIVNGVNLGKGNLGLQAAIDRVSRMPPGASIVWGPNYDRCGACSGSEPKNVAQKLYPDLWKKLEAITKQRKLHLSSNYPTPGYSRPDASPREKGQATIDWNNYRGPGTPHEEVLYSFDDEYVGRGDDGFDQLLKRLDELEEGTKLFVPSYEHGGRWAMETFSSEELQKQNEKLRDAFPFNARRTELGQKIKQRKLKLVLMPYPPAGKSPTTAIGWHSGDRRGSSFVNHGHMVRFDEKPRPAKAVLAWQGDASKTRGATAKATITLSGKELGTGTSAFAKAMDSLAQLPAESVVHVRVGVRTKPPFLCPIIYAGHRHFERTGFEPYVGMFPWLIDVAERHQLEIEWIPDEGETCYDCQLNR